MNEIGEKLKARRKDCFLSVPSLSAITGVPAGRIYRIENGDSKRLDLETLEKLAKALDLKVSVTISE